jgi:hypothetical protein
MSTSTTQVASVTFGFLENYMANVIDALKRLERIGNEHSDTTRKIIDAAEELSEKIASFYPESTTSNTPIVDIWEKRDGAVVSGTHMKYSLARRSEGQGLRVFNELKRQFVSDDREVALEFAVHIAQGLLVCIEEDLHRRTATDRSGLAAFQSEKVHKPLKFALAKRPIAWSRQGSSVAFSGPVFSYEIDGMPEGERALVTEIHDTWKFMRIKGDAGGDWIGDYTSADQALGALSSELEREFA